MITAGTWRAAKQGDSHKKGTYTVYNKVAHNYIMVFKLTTFKEQFERTNRATKTGHIVTPWISYYYSSSNIKVHQSLNIRFASPPIV